MWSRGHILAPLVMALYGTGPFSAPTPRRCPDHILSLLVSAFNRGPVWVVVTKGAQGADRVGSLYSSFLERRYQGRDFLNKGHKLNYILTQQTLTKQNDFDQHKILTLLTQGGTIWGRLTDQSQTFLIISTKYHQHQISDSARPVVTLHQRRVSGFGLRQIQISDW